MYNVNLLTTVSDCNAAIEKKTGEKSDLLVKKVVLEHDLSKGAVLANSIVIELQEILQTLPIKEAAYAVAAEGKPKRDLETEINTLENRRNKLIDRSESSGGLAFISDQMEVEEIDFKVTQIDNLVAQITTRRTELESVAPAA
jgi:hypothetical protein